MPKGIFPQSSVVLFDAPVSIAQLTGALTLFEPTNPQTQTVDADARWITADRSVTLPYRPEVNGYVVVEAIDAPWPDGMGSASAEPMLLGAWSMGHFGAYVWPGNLRRATQVAGAFTWHDAPAVVARHRTFVRIKSSYVLGAGERAPLAPADYEALPEASFVLDVAKALLAVDGALAYFNPNGEVLWDRAGLEKTLHYHARQHMAPLDAWSALRLFQPNEAEGWVLMDTIGMEQLEVADMEACYPSERFSGTEVSAFLRNASDYVREHGPIIRHGDTMDGPGELPWRALHATESLVARPRATVRWFPDDGTEPPSSLLAHTLPLP